jgi:hypothetical protein
MNNNKSKRDRKKKRNNNLQIQIPLNSQQINNIHEQTIIDAMKDQQSKNKYIQNIIDPASIQLHNVNAVNIANVATQMRINLNEQQSKNKYIQNIIDPAIIQLYNVNEQQSKGESILNIIKPETMLLFSLDPVEENIAHTVDIKNQSLLKSNEIINNKYNYEEKIENKIIFEEKDYSDLFIKYDQCEINTNIINDISILEKTTEEKGIFSKIYDYFFGYK